MEMAAGLMAIMPEILWATATGLWREIVRLTCGR